jgi:small GTP-binding protein
MSSTLTNGSNPIMAQAKPSLKLILLGDSGVGKTNIFLRQTRNQFNDGEVSTLGCDYHAMDIDVDRKTYSVKIWDTAGQERFRTIVESYYRDANGILLVYDQTERSSFAALSEWLTSIEARGDPNVAIVIVGNKSDLNEEVTFAEASELADQTKLEILSVSARTGDGIEAAFMPLMRLAIAKGASGPVAPVTQLNGGDASGGQQRCKC